MGVWGKAFLKAYTQYTATGWRALPETPPYTLLNTGSSSTGSKTIPLRVLTAVSPSAPASTAANPSPSMLWVLGGSLANTGLSPTADFTSSTTLLTNSGSLPNSVPVPSTCGHERFISTPSAPDLDTAAATLLYSSMDFPPTLTITGFPTVLALLMCSRNLSTPFPGKPTAFIE